MACSIEGTQPCAQCPYRLDAPRGVWAREHYEMLRDINNNPLSSVTFACHATRGRPSEETAYCNGWLLMQQKQGLPSLQLRIILGHEEGLGEKFEALDESTPLFNSEAELYEANLIVLDLLEEGEECLGTGMHVAGKLYADCPRCGQQLPYDGQALPCHLPEKSP